MSEGPGRGGGRNGTGRKGIPPTSQPTKLAVQLGLTSDPTYYKIKTMPLALPKSFPLFSRHHLRCLSRIHALPPNSRQFIQKNVTRSFFPQVFLFIFERLPDDGGNKFETNQVYF